MKAIKNLKVFTTIIATIILFAIPSFFLFGVVGHTVVFFGKAFIGEAIMYCNIPLMFLIGIIALAIWIPICYKYGMLYFKIVEKYNCKGWLYTPAY